MMSTVLISAQFPEPGNAATMLTLDVAPSQPGMILPFCFSFTGIRKIRGGRCRQENTITLNTTTNCIYMV